MAPLPSRESLEAMKRADLQKICKDYGVKANLKSEALIDLLLDTQSAPPQRPTRRSVSVRQPSRTESTRAGPSRVSSMIVHDISEDEEEQEEEKEADNGTTRTNSEQPESERPPSPPPLPPPRTRKAKELQTKLGVGKPVLAGGSGPRAVTRSSGSSRGKRTKSSKTMKPREATIEEEPEILTAEPKAQPEMPTPGRSPSQNEPLPPESANVTNGMAPNAAMLDINQLIAEAVRPLQDQIRTLKLELGVVTTIKSDIASLQEQVADVRKAQKDIKVDLQGLRGLETSVSALQDELKLLKEGDNEPPRPSTPKPKPGQHRSIPIGFGLPSVINNMASTLPVAGPSSENRSNSPLPHPGLAETTLGKRHRDSTSSDVPGVIEEGQEEEFSDGELAKTVIRPNKKKPKMSKERASSGEKAQTAGPSRLSSKPEEQAGSSSNRIGSGFSIYRGSEGPGDSLDPPPPTEHLPDFFNVDSPPEATTLAQGTRTAGGIPTSSAHAAENQPFNFAFAPISSTPANAIYMTSFPYPEPPQSPSPAGPSLPTFTSRHQEERTDIFKNFGLPSPHRSTRQYGALSHDERGVNPAALTQGTSIRREVSSNDVAAGLGLTAIRTTSSSDPPSTVEAPTIRRTMYGTELEGDTRFGDFGVEGVASGFWLSK